MVQCELSDRIWRVAGRTTLSIYSIVRDSWCIAITQLEQFEDSTKKITNLAVKMLFLFCTIFNLFVS